MPDNDHDRGSENRPARLRREQRQNRTRQEHRRERMRVAGVPETHRVNSAISEALSFVIASHQRAGTLTPELHHFAAEIGSAAVTVLIDRKHCDPAASKAAVLKQMRVRSAHGAGGALTLPPRKSKAT